MIRGNRPLAKKSVQISSRYSLMIIRLDIENYYDISMKKILKRNLQIDLPSNHSAFLWGPRKTGKSFWINTHYQEYPLIDL